MPRKSLTKNRHRGPRKLPPHPRLQPLMYDVLRALDADGRSYSSIARSAGFALDLALNWRRGTRSPNLNSLIYVLETVGYRLRVERIRDEPLSKPSSKTG